eukprot:15337454-Alexandrium_andersonii.AAC.1
MCIRDRYFTLRNLRSIEHLRRIACSSNFPISGVACSSKSRNFGIACSSNSQLLGAACPSNSAKAPPAPYPPLGSFGGRCSGRSWARAIPGSNA